MILLKGLDKAISKITRLMNIPYNDITGELADEAKRIVDGAYSSASSPGNNDWVSYVEPYKKGHRVVVTGSDVGFLEFGTGVETMPNDFAADMPYSVQPGTWSATHKREFVEKGHWYYGGKSIEGTPPTRGMQQALDYIRQEANVKAKIKIEKWIKGN